MNLELLGTENDDDPFKTILKSWMWDQYIPDNMKLIFGDMGSSNLWKCETKNLWNQNSETNKPRNFETKNLWNQETKKLRNQETEKLRN